jgi:hypothetical protein
MSFIMSFSTYIRYTTGVLHNLLLQATFEKYGASRRDNKGFQKNKFQKNIKKF